MYAFVIGMVFGVAAIWLPFEAVEPMARLVVPAIALLATSIFPCMSLAVGSLKAEQRAPVQVDELYTQLHTIMQVLAVTFALSVGTVICIIGLSSIVASNNMAALSAGGIGTGESAAVPIQYCARGLLICIAILLAVLGGRVVAVGKAFFVILSINRKHALLVARSKVQGDRDKAMDAVRRHRFAPDYSAPRELERGDV
jgi:hypothetical protein